VGDNMARTTINYKVENKSGKYFKFFLGLLAFVILIFSLFIFLLENSASSKKEDTTRFMRNLAERYPFTSDIQSVDIFDGKVTLYIVKDLKYCYMFSETTKLIYKHELSKMASELDAIENFNNNFSSISLGYDFERAQPIYEIIVTTDEAVGYYYYDALELDFIKSYVLGGK